MTQFWRHPKLSIPYDPPQGPPPKRLDEPRGPPVKTVWWTTRAADQAVWCTLFWAADLTVRRTKRKRGGATFLNFWIPENFQLPSDSVYVSSRNIPPSSAQYFFLRQQRIFSTSLRAHYVTFTYVFRTIFYVTVLRTSKPPIGPYFSI